MRITAVQIGLSFLCAGAVAAQVPDSNTFYSLGNQSSYNTGCFGPCDCAIVSQPLRGTFLLTFNRSDQWDTYYDVTLVNWHVTGSTTDRYITGSGTYRIGGDFVLQHQMILELSTNGGPPEHFDSGAVFPTTGLPAIDIRVSLHQETQCQDTVLDLHARPASTLYRLGKKSLFVQGCFPPCLCPVFFEKPVVGTFRLHFKGYDGLFAHYAVTDVDWKVIDLERHLTGSGHYKVGGEFAAQHQLTLDLSTNGGEPEHFDSGLVMGGTEFPAIDIDVSIHGQYCFDTAIRVQARPAGDFDFDGDADRDDLECFRYCATRADVLTGSGCRMTDLDGDGDSDMDDFGLMQRCLSGDGGQVDAECAE